MRFSKVSLPNPKRALRILIVENHSDTRKYLALYLEGVGYQVVVVATMEEALEVAPKSDCEVLVSDIGLPDGDGWELLERARFSHPIYAIAMSGYGMDTHRRKSRKARYGHHLLKPVDQLNKMLAEAEKEMAVSCSECGTASALPSLSARRKIGNPLEREFVHVREVSNQMKPPKSEIERRDCAVAARCP